MKNKKVVYLVVLALFLIMGGISIGRVPVSNSQQNTKPQTPGELKDYLVDVTSGGILYTVNSRREVFINKHIVNKLPVSEAMKIIDNIKSLADQCTPLDTGIVETYSYTADAKTTNFAENGLGCKEAQDSVAFLKSIKQ